MVMSPAAVSTVRDLLDAELGPAVDGGLRIAWARRLGQAGLKLEVVERPAVDDVIVEQAGVSLFLDEEAADYLVDKTLDVEPTAGDTVQFVVVPHNGRPLGLNEG